MAALIRAARTAQHLAVRALTAHGLAHPLTLALLAAASTTAARAWEAGHQVTDLHPANTASSPGSQLPGLLAAHPPEPLMQNTIVNAVYAPSADLPVNTNWRTAAVCRDEDPDLFFPIGTTGPAVVQAEEAKAVCRRCPVMERCLQWALESGQDHGVWGGTDEEDRRRIQRRTARRRQANKTAA